MQITYYYVFLPTEALREAAQTSGADFEAHPSVWSDIRYDRTGRKNSREAVESSFWNVFCAGLFYDEPEPANLVAFRKQCIDLGFQGCWSVVEADGGEACDLVAESADEAIPFLAQRSEQLKPPL